MWKDKEKAKTYWKNRYTSIVVKSKQDLGNVCVECGSDENLEFDHVDPSTKVANYTTLCTIKTIGEHELKKCQLLCRDCHKEKTSKEQGKAYHGGWTMYKYHKCRCFECKEFYRLYMKEYKRKWRLKKGIRPRSQVD